MRDAGVEGGRTASWDGKGGLVFGVTTAIDNAHSLVATMGERFVLARIATDVETELAASALDGVGTAAEWRARLARSVAGLLSNLDYRTSPQPADELERRVLINLSTFVARARSPVARDYRGDLELVHDPEGPARLVKALEQLRRGLRLIGLDQSAALDVVIKTGFDSVPKARSQVLDGFDLTGAARTTSQIASGAGLPTSTATRRLTELVAHGLLTRTSGGKGKSRQLAAHRLGHRTARANLARFVAPHMSSSWVLKNTKNSQDDFSGEVKAERLGEPVPLHPQGCDP